MRETLGCSALLTFIDEVGSPEALNNFLKTLSGGLQNQSDDCIDILEKYNVVVLYFLKQWAVNFLDALQDVAFEDKKNITPILISHAQKLGVLLRYQQYFQLPKMIFDFTKTYFFPAHQVLICAANLVSTTEKCACQILFPGVTRIIGTAQPAEIKESSEDQEGRFVPSEYILEADGSVLYYVMGLLDYVRDNVEFSKIFFPVSTQRNLFIQRHGQVMSMYIRMLDFLYEKKTVQTNTFGFQLHQLIVGLYERSENRDGQGRLASEIYKEHLAFFYPVWLRIRKTLDAKIVHYRVRSNTPTLDEELHILFLHDGLLLNQAEMDAVKGFWMRYTNGVPHCVAVASTVLKEMLEKNLWWYSVSITDAAIYDDIYTQEHLTRQRYLVEDQISIYYLKDQNDLVMILRSEKNKLREFCDFVSAMTLLSDSINFLNTDFNPANYCRDQKTVIKHLLQTPNYADRRTIWHGFEKWWVQYFIDFDSIIFLHYILKEKYIEKFYGKIRDALSLSPEKCTHFSLKLIAREYSIKCDDALYLFFIGLLESKSLRIVNENPFLHFILACSRKSELNAMFALMKDVEHTFFNDESNTKIGSKALSILLRTKEAIARNETKITYSQFSNAFLEFTLPEKFNKERLVQPGETQKTNCCVFFDAHPDPMCEKIMACENPIEIITLVYGNRKKSLLCKKIVNEYDEKLFEYIVDGEKIASLPGSPKARHACVIA